MKRTVKIIITSFIVLIILTLNVYGLSFEASNHYELENIILEQMREYNPVFNIKYTGSLDNIEEVLKSMIDKDTYL